MVNYSVSIKSVLKKALPVPYADPDEAHTLGVLRREQQVNKYYEGHREILTSTLVWILYEALDRTLDGEIRANRSKILKLSSDFFGSSQYEDFQQKPHIEVGGINGEDTCSIRKITSFTKEQLKELDENVSELIMLWREELRQGRDFLFLFDIDKVWKECDGEGDYGDMEALATMRLLELNCIQFALVGGSFNKIVVQKGATIPKPAKADTEEAMRQQFSIDKLFDKMLLSGACVGGKPVHYMRRNVLYPAPYTKDAGCEVPRLGILLPKKKTGDFLYDYVGYAETEAGGASIVSDCEEGTYHQFDRFWIDGAQAGCRQECSWEMLPYRNLILPLCFEYCEGYENWIKFARMIKTPIGELWGVPITFEKREHRYTFDIENRNGVNHDTFVRYCNGSPAVKDFKGMSDDTIWFKHKEEAFAYAYMIGNYGFDRDLSRLTYGKKDKKIMTDGTMENFIHKARWIYNACRNSGLHKELLEGKRCCLTGELFPLTKSGEVDIHSTHNPFPLVWGDEGKRMRCNAKANDYVVMARAEGSGFGTGLPFALLKAYGTDC